MQKLTWSETRPERWRKISGCAWRERPVNPRLSARYFDPPKPLGYYADIRGARLPDARRPKQAPDNLPANRAAPDGKRSQVPMCSWRRMVQRKKPLPASPPRRGQPGLDSVEAAPPFPARTLHLDFSPGGAAQGGSLLASDDGSHWRKVRAVHIAQRQCGLRLRSSRARAVLESGLRGPRRHDDWRLGSAAFRAYRIEDWTGKAVVDMFGLDKPLPPPTSAKAPADSIIPRERIVNLTKQPEARWHAGLGCAARRMDRDPLRIHADRPAHPAPPRLTAQGGLEGDKFNPAALDLHWKYALAPFLDDGHQPARAGDPPGQL